MSDEKLQCVSNVSVKIPTEGRRSRFLNDFSIFNNAVKDKDAEKYFVSVGGGLAPAKAHPSLQDARDEAVRLSEMPMNIGKRVTVSKIISVYKSAVVTECTEEY